MKHPAAEEFIRQLDAKLGCGEEYFVSRRDASLYSGSTVFSPLEMGGLTLKNRIIQECADFALETLKSGAAAVITPVYYDRSLDAMSGWFRLQDEAHTRKAYVFAELIAEQDISSPLAAALESGAMLKEAANFADEVIFQKWDGIYFVDRLKDDFGLKLIKKLRSRLPRSMPIIYRIAVSGAGRSIAQTFDYMEKLCAAGVDMFCPDFGHEAWMQSEKLPRGCYTDIAKTVRDYFKCEGLTSTLGIIVPIAAVGRLADPRVCEAALADGKCDAVIVENAVPGFCRLAASCIDAKYASARVRRLLSLSLPACEKTKNIAVIGGGNAGLAFSLFAAKCGHNVELFETSQQLGGRLNAESLPSMMYELRNYTSVLKEQVESNDKITVHTGTVVSAGIIKAGGYDAVVYAAGCRRKRSFGIPGWGDIPYISAEDVMKNPALLGKSRRISVIGCDDFALECAWFIKNELGCANVNVVSSAVSGDAWTLHYLEKSGVRVALNAALSKLSNRSVFFSCPGKKGEITRSFRSDLLVIAVYEGSDDTAYREALHINAAPEIFMLEAYSSAEETEEAAYELAISI